MPLIRSSTAVLLQFGVPLERRVQVVDVRCVVLVVVDPHRLRVDVRLQRVVVVGQRRNFVSHSAVSFFRSILSAAELGRWALEARDCGLGLGTGIRRNLEHAVEREAGVALLVSGTMIWLWIWPSTSPSRTHSR